MDVGIGRNKAKSLKTEIYTYLGLDMNAKFIMSFSGLFDLVG